MVADYASEAVFQLLDLLHTALVKKKTTDYCKNTLKIMMNGYGYHYASTHALQDNTTPVENIIAMYQAAHDFGVYV